MNKPKVDIIELFSIEKSNNTYLKVAAPMVRYSKLEFRKLLRKYKTQLCFTPMIVADPFCQSEEARNSEFTTSIGDTPLIAQFAAKNSIELRTATELVYPYVDGVDINCGCPQKWAIAKSYGCALLKKPEIIHDMIKSVQNLTYKPFSCSVKIRLLNKKDIKSTIEYCRQIEHCGASFISLHGRTPWEKSSDPVDVAAVADIKKSIRIPVIFNGDIKTLFDAEDVFERTKCDGIMCARGLLTNPTLFTGTECTSLQCIQDWYNICSAADNKVSYQCFHHHLTFMMEKLVKKKTRSHFNNFTKKNQVNDFLMDYFKMNVEQESNLFKNYDESYVECSYNDEVSENYKLKYGSKVIQPNNESWNESNDGKYFREMKNSFNSESQDDWSLNSMFEET